MSNIDSDTTVSEYLELSDDISVGDITIDISNMAGQSAIYIDNTLAGNNSIGSGTYTITTGSSGTGGLYGDYITDSYSSDLRVEGNANIYGKLNVGGVDIVDTLTKIEERLAILRVNTELESRWERLKDLGEQYRKLEAEILDQEKVYNILKR